MPNTLSKAEKVYGLSKFWQEVNYNFVYLDKVDKEKWKENYIKLIPLVQETKDDYEYYRLLQKFCAQLNDGHTNIFFPKEIQSKMQTTYFGEYRLFLTNINGKAIVTRVNLSKKKEIPVGSEVIRVNGINTKEYIKEFVEPYIASSTVHVLEDMSVWQLLSGPIGTSFNIELKLPDGKIKKLKLTHAVTEEKELHPPFEQRELLEFKWLKNKTAYLALNSFVDKKIETLFIEKLPELYKAKKLIIDLRNNGGGSSDIAVNIFKYLTKDTLLYGSKWRSRLHNSAYKSWGPLVEAKDTIDDSWARQSFLSLRDEFYYDAPYKPKVVTLNNKRITIPTVILIGHQTGSAAEDFLIYGDNQKHMTKIGEPTNGSTGNPFWFDLPGGGQARVCAKKDTYPDGREFVGYGILPDIEVKKTLTDYLENKDAVLEVALKYLNKN